MPLSPQFAFKSIIASLVTLNIDLLYLSLVAPQIIACLKRRRSCILTLIAAEQDKVTFMRSTLVTRGGEGPPDTQHKPHFNVNGANAHLRPRDMLHAGAAPK